MALGRCSNEGCQARVEVGDVYKQVPIPKSPQFVALVYECPVCGDKNKIVASMEDWAETQKRAAAARDIRQNDFRVHQIELDAIEGPDDLVALWSSLLNPPLREERRGACGCPQCEEKWNGKRIQDD